MLSIFNTKLHEIDRLLASAKPSDVPGLFRDIPIDVFGKLLLDVPSAFPHIRAFLPSMTSEEVQLHWTGAHGEVLQAQSVAFVRSLVSGFTRLSGMAPENATMLDFGCGWGRLIRLLYKYTSYENIYAVDPWDRSIEECRAHGIRAHLALSECVPRSLPFAGPFDLIFAFSVFTHLSERTARYALETLRDYIAPEGVLVITIRPVEYWHHHRNGSQMASMTRAHAEKGFAFAPSDSAPLDGDITFGDTSISLEYLERNFPRWEIAGVDYNQIDHYQILLFLKPA